MKSPRNQVLNLKYQKLFRSWYCLTYDTEIECCSFHRSFWKLFVLMLLVTGFACITGCSRYELQRRIHLECGLIHCLANNVLVLLFLFQLHQSPIYLRKSVFFVLARLLCNHIHAYITGLMLLSSNLLEEHGYFCGYGISWQKTLCVYYVNIFRFDNVEEVVYRCRFIVYTVIRKYSTEIMAKSLCPCQLGVLNADKQNLHNVIVQKYVETRFVRGSQSTVQTAVVHHSPLHGTWWLLNILFVI